MRWPAAWLARELTPILVVGGLVVTGVLDHISRPGVLRALRHTSFKGDDPFDETTMVDDHGPQPEEAAAAPDAPDAQQGKAPALV